MNPTWEITFGGAGGHLNATVQAADAVAAIDAAIIELAELGYDNTRASVASVARLDAYGTESLPATTDAAFSALTRVQKAAPQWGALFYGAARATRELSEGFKRSQ
jgi:metal-dependent amidase/aminoacylase/carboxypeptidase family protein